MMGTDPLREPHPFENGHWLEKEEIPPRDYEAEIAKYNKNNSRFLFYPWAVFCTAYARRNLLLAVLETGVDHVYSDTDSDKFLHADRHMKWFETYNQMITARLELAMEHHGLDKSLLRPRVGGTPDGAEKPLGVWEFDGHYSKFKTLGAKRYLVQYSGDKRNGDDSGKIRLTVSWLNKQTCVNYMIGKWGDRIFDEFNDEMEIPPEFTGKNVHYYINEPRDGLLTDYLGNTAEYHELSGVHIDSAGYSLKLSDALTNYIEGMGYDEW